MRGMLIKSPEGYLKIEIRLYQVYVVFPLVRVKDNVVLLKKLSQSKGASRHTIIKLANIHARLSIDMKGIRRGTNESDF